MYSIALKRSVAGTLMVLASYACDAAATKPRFFQDPVLGLRYDLAKHRFDNIPASDLVNCENYQDTSTHSATRYIYGKVKDPSGRTYYVSGGYDIFHDPANNETRYETTNFGAVFYIDANNCVYIDEARQTFENGIFNDETPQHVIQALALDVAARLQRAFGGAERLKVELRNQRIDLESLPTELKQAFKGFSTR